MSRLFGLPYHPRGNACSACCSLKSRQLHGLATTPVNVGTVLRATHRGPRVSPSLVHSRHLTNTCWELLSERRRRVGPRGRGELVGAPHPLSGWSGGRPGRTHVLCALRPCHVSRLLSHEVPVLVQSANTAVLPQNQSPHGPQVTEEVMKSQKHRGQASWRPYGQARVGSECVRATGQTPAGAGWHPAAREGRQ